MQKHLPSFLKMDFKKISTEKNPNVVKLMNTISDGFNMYLFMIIYIFIAFTMADIFLLIISPNPDFNSIVSTGERGTILMATIAVLTLTYAAASEFPEKNDILISGKYFFKSVLTFVIGIILSIGCRKSLINPSNAFGLPEPFYDFSIKLMFALLISGLAILIVSAYYFAKGITDLSKSLQK